MWMPVRRLIGAGYFMSTMKREPQTMSTLGSAAIAATSLEQLARIVLAVAVDLGHVGVALLLGVDEARPARRRRRRG